MPNRRAEREAAASEGVAANRIIVGHLDENLVSFEPGLAVLAQAGRGGPQHQISRVLTGCDIIADDERTGRAAGVARAAAGTTDVVDAIVIATAVRHRAPVVTSDPGDLAESPAPSASRSSSTHLTTQNRSPPQPATTGAPADHGPDTASDKAR